MNSMSYEMIVMEHKLRVNKVLEAGRYGIGVRVLKVKRHWLKEVFLSL